MTQMQLIYTDFFIRFNLYNPCHPCSVKIYLCQF